MFENKQPKELAVYIHIPFFFCLCLYCDFLSAAPSDDKVMDEYKNALINQIRSSAYLADDFNIRTVFFGGGTPSLYEGSDIAEILGELKAAFEGRREGSYAPVEVTIECNPGTVNIEKLIAYKKCGINRLSIGLQSACDSELKLLGRIHTYEDWKNTMSMAVEAGFDNISTDLISAIPGQSVDDFKQTLETVLTYEKNLKHISVYSLIIEEGTPFYDMFSDDMSCSNRINEKEGITGEYDEWFENRENIDREIYSMTGRILAAHGYNRYEISNYAKPGYESEHNLVYWNRGDYIGFGIGAASMMNNIRIKNTESLSEYIIDPINCVIEKESLSKEEQMSEYFILGLRKCEGVSLSRFQTLYNNSAHDVFGSAIEKWTKEGLLEIDGDMLRCTMRGLDLNNIILLPNRTAAPQARRPRLFSAGRPAARPCPEARYSDG